MPIPVSWMERCRLDVENDKLHQLLKLDGTEAAQLVEATGQAMKTAKQEQAAEFEGRVMRENDPVHLPALSDEAIRSHVEEAVAVLPENLSAAEKDLVRFLVKRRITEEYGRDLEVTLTFTGGLTLPLIYSSRNLVGFYYMVRSTSPQDGASPMHYSVGDPRFDFLQLDPSVSNEGRNPLDR